MALSRILSRGARYREFGSEKSDSYWIGAAYVKGGFPDAEKDMKPLEFAELFSERISGYDFTWLLFTRLDRGETPTGIIIANVHEHMIQPHVFWFPWAPMRARFECAAAFFSGIAAHWMAVITVKKSEVKLFARLAQHGLLTHAGEINGYFDAENGVVYQTERK